MPFLEIPEKFGFHYPLKFRKESKDFSQAYHFHYFYPYSPKRASVSASGSVTAEAAFILPLFFFAVVCLLAIFEMEAVKLTVGNSLACAGQQIAYEDYGKKIFLPVSLSKQVASGIGKDVLSRSLIENGQDGISCVKSFRTPGSHIYTFTAEYKIRMPFSVFGIPPVSQKVTFRMKGWNGYERTDESGEGNEIVYITEAGEVYHRNRHCTYLDLTIRTAASAQVGELRNRYQEKYRACEYCGWACGETVYITSMGNRYHSSLRCSGLKRQVRAVTMEEAGERRACSRCGY